MSFGRIRHTNPEQCSLLLLFSKYYLVNNLYIICLHCIKDVSCSAPSLDRVDLISPLTVCLMDSPFALDMSRDIRASKLSAGQTWWCHRTRLLNHILAINSKRRCSLIHASVDETIILMKKQTVNWLNWSLAHSAKHMPAFRFEIPENQFIEHRANSFRQLPLIESNWASRWLMAAYRSCPVRNNCYRRLGSAQSWSGWLVKNSDDRWSPGNVHGVALLKMAARNLSFSF